MKKIFFAICFWLPLIGRAQASKYYGWWEHKGALYALDSATNATITEYSNRFQADTSKLKPLAETEVQFSEDSFKLQLGISVLTGDGDSRDFKWFKTYIGYWKLDNTLGYKLRGKRFTIRENSFTNSEDHWKDSIVNRTILVTADSADLMVMYFNDGQRASGVFKTQKEYPYTWFYLDFGFGNLFTRFY